MGYVRLGDELKSVTRNCENTKNATSDSTHDPKVYAKREIKIVIII